MKLLHRLAAPIEKLLRIPPQPSRPLGTAESVQTFRAAAGFFRYRLLIWGWAQASAVVGLVVGVYFLGFLAGISHWIRYFDSLAIVGLVAQMVFTLLMISLDYRYRWYVVTDRSLRIREGLWKVRERTMTFSNIQNLSVRQGPLQRLFGIADLQVRSAGGGSAKAGETHDSSGDDMHVGYFRGVANATEIRDGILAHLRRIRSDGLDVGDESVRPAALPEPSSRRRLAASSGALEAAREVLREARALRQAV